MQNVWRIKKTIWGEIEVFFSQRNIKYQGKKSTDVSGEQIE